MASTPKSGEFDLIARYFAPLAGPAGLGLKDDAACFLPPEGRELVISKDMLVAGTHFFPDDGAADVAFKALSVNISDLAAKGARPEGYLLGLTLPNSVGDTWVGEFSAGLQEAQDLYEVALFGGDTTSGSGPVVVSITVIGSTEKGTMLKRSGAEVGDHIYVSGTLGNGALGLMIRNGDIEGGASLLQSYLRPTAQLKLGLLLTEVASASADVSDGLLADVGHICGASGVGARIDAACLPVSVPVRQMLDDDPALWSRIWAGGDDYEIVFTAPPNREEALFARAKSCDTQITRIGVITDTSAVELVDSTGQNVQVDKSGYTHF